MLPELDERQGWHDAASECEVSTSEKAVGDSEDDVKSALR